jgi:hypothetical protein
VAKVLLLQDLELHHSFLKRVKVLVSTVGELAAHLLDQAQQKEQQLDNFGGDLSLIETTDIHRSLAETTSNTPSAGPSKTPLATSKTPLSAGWISFRSKRNLEQTAALAESLRKDFKFR